MKILDTNLWVFGTLQTHDSATRLLTEIETGETTSAINAYMVHEALNAFDRTTSLSPAERDTAKTAFLTRLTRMTGLLEAPSSRDVRNSLLEQRRSASAVQLLGRICDIQPKDVPVLILVFEHRDHQPTILTNDESFAKFEPGAHSLSEIAMEYVP